ncbi:MAG TPA: energy transducer TonB [Blastocatellia bacterium]|nr:energy transducer TonB [Blastocatellia bacterium]
MLYVVLILVIAIATIVGTNVGLTDVLDVQAMIAPPPPPPAPPPPAPAAAVIKHIPEVVTFTPPKKPPEKIPDPSTVKAKPVVAAVSTGVPGGVPGGQAGGVVGGAVGRGDDAPPPPPPPKPEGTPIPRIIKVSGGVDQGNAIKKVQPQYPPIAKSARASGAVQIQVTISEDGRVIEASVVSGHPLLRDAALQAAKQWIFKPTALSGVPVKVQGILTFNFTLQ